VIRPIIPQIAVDPPELSGNTIRFRLHVSRPLRKYFLNDVSYVQYDGIDLKKVNNSLLAIPILSMIAPIAWAVGADIHAAELDAAYLQGLAKVKDVYRSVHTNFSFSGDISAEKVIPNKFDGGRTGMLFSGGVDSLTSYLRHRDLKPDFISIWGLPDIPPFEERFWDRMWTDIRSLADLDGITTFQVKTDMFRNINHELLTRQFGIGWFVGAAFGLFMLGLCAPVTAIRGLGTVIIASSYTKDFKGRYGSHPLIDNNVSWADVKVIHDGFELSRQQKLNYLCKEQNARYLSHLRVCWDSALKTNCGDCEKCMRTIVGLVIEGIDPNKCNFHVDRKTLPLIRDCFRKGRVALHEGTSFVWRDLQKHIPDQINEDIYGSREFLEWLKEYDLSQYRENKLSKLIWDARRLYRYKRTNAPSGLRKLKCYYYIALDKLGLI
jgi:hypothetical protein